MTEDSRDQYFISITLDTDPASARPLVERALADQGFGILTEIDVAATLKKKLDKDVPPQVILGACNPHLAAQALEVEPAIGVLLPCNVVLRETEAGRTLVSAIDPGTMVTFTGNAGLETIAAQARTQLSAALHTLAEGDSHR